MGPVNQRIDPGTRADEDADRFEPAGETAGADAERPDEVESEEWILEEAGYGHGV